MKTQSETFYKVLDPGRICRYGKGSWPPPGEWLEVKGQLVPCEHGLHLCRRRDLVEWLGQEIWTAEYRGERIDAGDKIVVRKARLIKKLDNWNERNAWLFALDCAEHVLPLFEKVYPDDKRPHNAIRIARQYVLGKATDKQLATARTTAWTAVAWGATFVTTKNTEWGRKAARAAANATERDAARAADTAWNAAYVATSVPACNAPENWEVAVDAARTTARAADWLATERKWKAVDWLKTKDSIEQAYTDKLFEYLD